MAVRMDGGRPALDLGGEDPVAGARLLRSDWKAVAAAPSLAAADSLSAPRAVLLAQAQRCIYEKARERGLSAATLETLAGETSALYAEAHGAVCAALAAPRAALAASLAADWRCVPECGMLLYESLAQTHAAAAHAAAHEFGMQVARLRHARRLVAARGGSRRRLPLLSRRWRSHATRASAPHARPLLVPRRRHRLLRLACRPRVPQE